MLQRTSDWERAVEFHGHICPGLAMGYRASQAGMRELGSLRAPDEEIVAIVETDSCGVDAVQVVTGCTFGKGNLIFRDYGKHVFTFVCRASGKAVRICVKPRGRQSAGDGQDRVSEDSASHREQAGFQQYHAGLVDRILQAAEEELLAISEVSVEMPPQARIFRSVECAFCGEPVMEPRARVRDGKFACIPCAERYSKGQ